MSDHSSHAHLLAGVSLFIAVYLAAFLTLSFAASAFGVRNHYWIALASAALATWFTVRVVESGKWSIGFFVAPSAAIREWLLGLLFAAAVIGVCDALIVFTTPLRHAGGGAFPFGELAIIFIPAAIHEEILFRGYVYQRIRAASVPAAVALTSLVFALLHASNRGFSTIALSNLVLAGVLLALAYERYQRLWFPIGIHFGWNVLSGPLLGYDVSGFAAQSTVFRTVGSAPPWISGATFGIEGSAMMTIVEIAAVVALGHAIVKRRSSPPDPASETAVEA